MTEFEYRDQIYKKAADVKTKDDLDAVLTEIRTHAHDYSTIVYGCAAAMKAAFNYINRSDAGGITGFQAGCLGWEIIKEFMFIKGPARLVDYENMLYPQYQRKFSKTITPDTWEHLQKKAKELIGEERNVHPDVLAHWKSIAAGDIPFGYALGQE